MKTKTKTSGPDRNDKMMRLAGFKRDPEWDGQNFNKCGGISYWVNDIGLRIVTDKRKRLSLKDLVLRVANHAAYKTRNRFREQVAAIDSGKKGYIKDTP